MICIIVCNKYIKYKFYNFNMRVQRWIGKHLNIATFVLVLKSQCTSTTSNCWQSWSRKRVVRPFFYVRKLSFIFHLNHILLNNSVSFLLMWYATPKICMTSKITKQIALTSCICVNISFNSGFFELHLGKGIPQNFVL